MNKAGWKVGQPKGPTPEVVAANPPSGSPSTAPSAAAGVAKQPEPATAPQAAVPQAVAPVPRSTPNSGYIGQPARPPSVPGVSYGTGPGRSF